MNPTSGGGDDYPGWGFGGDDGSQPAWGAAPAQWSDSDPATTSNPDRHPGLGGPARPPVITGAQAWVFSSVQDWVIHWLAPTISIELTATAPYWCAQWWRHREAVARLDACWRAWEHFRERTCAATDPAPAGMSLWWRDHGNPHLDALLMSSRSPFRLCARGIHATPDPPLPAEQPPVGWSAAPSSLLQQLPSRRR